MNFDFLKIFKKDKKELISVIITVYQVKDYIEKCIESVINQTYKNLEIIVIDDGSTDGSSEILDKYALEDKRIKVIHKENGGVGNARNTGIKMAKGKYLYMIDGDDYISENTIEKLYNNLKEEDADISVCNFLWIYEDGKEKNDMEQVTKKRFCATDDTKYYNLYNEYYVSTVVPWNKLYKKEIFNGVKYPSGIVHEDEYVICDILQNAKKISYMLDEDLYYYIQRSNSITKTFNMARLGIDDALDNRIKFFKERNMEELVYKTLTLKKGKLANVLKNIKEQKLSDEDMAIVKKYENKLKEIDENIRLYEKKHN